MASLFDDTLINEMNSNNPKIIMAVEILFKNAPVRAHTGFGEIVLDGQTYLGVGNLGTIEPIKQTSNNGSSTLELAMSGLDPTLVAGILNQRTAGSKVKIYICSLDDDFVINSSSIVFSGRVSTSGFTYSESMSVNIKVVDRLADWKRAGSRRFDYESHSSEYPDDKIFKYTAQISERPIYWGSEKDQAGFNRR